jgi:hypothetical protein
MPSFHSRRTCHSTQTCGGRKSLNRRCTARPPPHRNGSPAIQATASAPFNPSPAGQGALRASRQEVRSPRSPAPNSAGRTIGTVCPKEWGRGPTECEESTGPTPSEGHRNRRAVNVCRRVFDHPHARTAAEFRFGGPPFPWAKVHASPPCAELQRGYSQPFPQKLLTRLSTGAESRVTCGANGVGSNFSVPAHAPARAPHERSAATPRTSRAKEERIHLRRLTLDPRSRARI